MLSRLNLIVVTLWVGALWMTGLTAYVLFDSLQDKQLAGSLAGKLFTMVSYIGAVSAFYLLVQRLLDYGTASLKQGFFWAVFFMLLLILAGHFGIQPILAQLKTDALPNDVMQSVFANRFKAWHGVASVAYLVECLLGFVLVLKVR
jgi:NADH:ubiquinone oxidoreductase subunit 6 (subunit J)